MKRILTMGIFTGILASLGVTACKVDPALAPNAKSLHEFSMKDIDGKEQSLKKYEGKVVVVVNVASKCGLTPQYEALQALYEKYKDKGLVILGFPANNFMGQEPGTDAEIKTFCTTKFNVSFPMFSKISVAGDDMHPLYRWLIKESKKDSPIDWNFAKFLVDGQGQVIGRFSARTKPTDEAFVKAIEAALAALPASGK